MIEKTIIAAVLFGLVSLFPQESTAGSVQGTVVDDMGIPVIGIKALLLHPTAGISRPRYTDKSGHFSFVNTPKVDTPYYLELYWNERLVHRQLLENRENIKSLEISL